MNFDINFQSRIQKKEMLVDPYFNWDLMSKTSQKQANLKKKKSFLINFLHTYQRRSLVNFIVNSKSKSSQHFI